MSQIPQIPRKKVKRQNNPKRVLEWLSFIVKRDAIGSTDKELGNKGKKGVGK